MKCPFLQETQVKYCRHSTVRKMIVRTPANVPGEKCSSSRYVECDSFRQHAEDAGTMQSCPFLEEAWMQYCGAAAVPRFIPYSDAVFSRCTGAGYRYCELYVAMEQPQADAGNQDASRPADELPAEYSAVDSIRVPKWLHYSPNHLWLHYGEDGLCHVGIDGFLARALGRLERVSFILPGRAGGRASAVLTVRAADLVVTFPNALLDCQPNLHLRADSSKLATDPYTLGWLFKGFDPHVKGAAGGSVLTGLLPGSDAADWMRTEVDVLSRAVHEAAGECVAGDGTGRSSAPGGPQQPEMNDGGEFAEGVIARFPREQALQLFNAFFSPYRSWTRQT